MRTDSDIYIYKLVWDIPEYDIDANHCECDDVFANEISTISSLVAVDSIALKRCWQQMDEVKLISRELPIINTNARISERAAFHDNNKQTVG